MANHKDGRDARIGVRLPDWQSKAVRYIADEEGVTASDVFVTALSCVLGDPVLSAHLRTELGKRRPTPKAPSEPRQKAASVQRKRTPQASPSTREIA